MGGVGVGRAYRELSREVPVPASPLADHMTWASRGATPSLSYLFSFMETLSKLGHWLWRCLCAAQLQNPCPLSVAYENRWFVETSRNVPGTRDCPGHHSSEQSSENLCPRGAYTSQCFKMLPIKCKDKVMLFHNSCPLSSFREAFSPYVVIKRESFIKPWGAEIKPPQGLCKGTTIQPPPDPGAR